MLNNITLFNYSKITSEFSLRISDYNSFNYNFPKFESKKVELMTKIEKFIEDNQDRLFRDIARLITVNSVEKLGENGTPFGEGPKKALTEALMIADKLGLGTRNCEDKIGYAFVGGEGKHYLATITHVDVVPAGNGWKADPFVMRDVDGYVLGRGVLDDKGPSVICLYALKFIKEYK